MFFGTTVVLQFEIACLGNCELLCFPPPVCGATGEHKQGEVNDPGNAYCQTNSLLQDGSSSSIFPIPIGNTHDMKAKNTFAAISILPNV